MSSIQRATHVGDDSQNAAALHPKALMMPEVQRELTRAISGALQAAGLS